MKTTKTTISLIDIDFEVAITEYNGECDASVQVIGVDGTRCVTPKGLRELADAMDRALTENAEAERDAYVAQWAPRVIGVGHEVYIEGRTGSKRLSEVVGFTPTGKARVRTHGLAGTALFTFDSTFGGKGAWVSARKQGPMNISYREVLLLAN